MVVLVIITFMVSQLMTSATAITRTGNKHFDTDTQARVVLDRMALDFAQMVKRTDVDYYVKQKVYKDTAMATAAARDVTETKAVTRSRSTARCQAIHPAAYFTEQSPISLVAYRVNEGNDEQRSCVWQT